jgi:hypothetical protein
MKHLLAFATLLTFAATVASGGVTAAVPRSWRIHRSGVGPIRLGVQERQVRRFVRSHGLRAKSVSIRSHEDTEEPHLDIYDGRERLVRLGLDSQSRRVYVVEVTSPRLLTREGARVGMRLRTLARLYGRGDVDVPSDDPDADPPDMQVDYRRRNYTFSFGDSPAVLRARTWPALLHLNPPVRRISVRQ